jgi:hypothetical protein
MESFTWRFIKGKMKRRYWISTQGKATILFSGITLEPSFEIKAMYEMVECSAFRFHLTNLIKRLEKIWHKKS